MTTIASATPGASRVPKAEVTGKLAAGWLTAAAVLADLGLGAGVAGDLLYGSGANTLARLPIATAGRVLVAGASAPAWSDSGLSYASGVLTVAGSVPGTPSSGQVMIGGGVIKAGTAVYGADGSAAAPGIRTTTYAHGLYSAASTILGVTVGGVATLQVASPGGGIGAGFRSLTTADGDYCYFLSDRANAELRITAGNTTTNGANLQLFGSGHATASTGRLRVSGTSVLEWTATSITAAQNLTVPNGSATAPGIRTTTYAHGLHSIGATSVGIDVAGALVLTVGATASSFASGTTVQFSNTTTAGNGTGSVICNGGGYFAKAVFAANDASGVHYYGNSGLTMRDLGTGTSTYLDLAFGSASHGAYNIRSSNAATVRFNIDTSGHVTLGGTAGNYLNINNATGELRINGTKVSGPRDTGWTAMTGTTDKATAYDTATVTLPQLAGRVMALQAALTAHGKIGT